MSNLSLRNIKILTLFDLKNNKKFIMGWSIALFGIMFLYMILFPSIKDMAEVKINSMPKELLQFVGMEGFSDLNNFISYFGMIYNIFLVVISIFAAIFSANLIYKEEKTKSIEFLYSRSVSRGEIYLSKLITSFIGVMLVVMSACISSMICGFISGGETFILIDFIQIAKISSFTAFFFISTSIFVVGVTTKLNGASVGSMVVLGSYLFGYLGKLLEDKAEWLLYLSPFELFSPTKALDLNNELIINMSVYILIMIILIATGYRCYIKRDYNI